MLIKSKSRDNGSISGPYEGGREELSELPFSDCLESTRYNLRFATYMHVCSIQLKLATTPLSNNIHQICNSYMHAYKYKVHVQSCSVITSMQYASADFRAMDTSSLDNTGVF